MFNPYLDTISSNWGATNFDLCRTTVVKVLYCFNTCCDTSTLILNKRPMGHIAHLNKQLKSINTYDYIITLINRRKKNIIKLMIIYWFFKKLESLSSKDACAKIDWNWLSGSGEEEFFNFVNVFSLFLNYLPLEKGGALHLNKVEYPSPKDALWQVLLKMAKWFWRRRFLNFVNVFSLFRNYLPLGKDMNMKEH